MPITLQVDLTALKNLKDSWQLPDDVIARAQVVVDDTGRHIRTQTQTASAK
jgi:hypothetical protein